MILTKSFVAAGLLGLLTAHATPGQQPPSQDDPVERQVERLKESLRLTDQQLPKVREVLKKQTDDLKGLLNDEQKRQYDEMNRFRGRFGTGGPGGSTSSRSSSWWPAVDDMRTPLQLTETQMTKINEIRDNVRQELRNYFTNRPAGSNFSREESEAFQKKLREDNTKKIRDLLTDTQKTKFDQLLQEHTTRTDAEERDPRNRFRGPSVSERVSGSMDLLRIESTAEAEVVRGVLRKVVEIMDKLETFQREGRDKFEEASRNKDLSDEAVSGRIEEFRKGQRDLEKELSNARKELAAIVTSRQELELIRRGILK